MHESAENKYRADNRYGDVPGDDFLPQHVGQTQKQRQGADFTQRTTPGGMIADEEVE